ncbi:hypothetical protein ACFQ9H_35930 [Streptomyces sp. NPDC056517]|uniref:hypothetical protein n=1 Tax=Streptomyces sp. NPDC056517 TaxID=3345848 RepID=UPI0036C9F818
MKKTTAGLALAGAVATSLMTLAPTASAADGCQRDWLTTGQNSTWTTVNKSGSGCHDVQVVEAAAPGGDSGDSYRALYRNASGAWTWASRPYQWIYNGSYPVSRYVLISDLTTGREFGVAAYNNIGGAVQVAH